MGRLLLLLLLLRALALLAALGAAATTVATAEEEDAAADVCCGWVESDEWPLEIFPCPVLDVGPNVTFCCHLCYPRDACPFEEEDGAAWAEQEQCPDADGHRPAAPSALLQRFWRSPFLLPGILGVAAAAFVMCMLRCHSEDPCLQGSDSDSAPADSGADVYARLRDDHLPPAYGACAGATPQCSVTGLPHCQNLPDPSTENPAGLRQEVSGIPRKDNETGLPSLTASEGAAVADGAPEPTLPTESRSSLVARSDAETDLG